MTKRGAQFLSKGAIPLIGPEKLVNIMARASDTAMVVSSSGVVLSIMINPDNDDMKEREDWHNTHLQDTLTYESRSKLESRMKALTIGKSAIEVVELNHRFGDGELPMRYSMFPIGSHESILMLGTDLRPIAAMQQRLVEAQMALEKDYEIQRAYDTRLRVLMDNSAESLVFVSLATGRISSLNQCAADMLGGKRDALRGRTFSEGFCDHRGDMMERLLAAAGGGSGSASVELQTRRAKHRVTVTPIVFRAAGERMLLCRMTCADGETGTPDARSDVMNALFNNGVDAIVFVDRTGIITLANDAFLIMADATEKAQIEGRSIADFLDRGTVDMRVIIDNSLRFGHMRLYATKLTSEHGSSIPVEISATYLGSAEPALVALVIRAATRSEVLRQPGAAVSDLSGMKPAMELVGSATLKDIVSETTDVIEKICIETAVELTRNNRVAAAEMLGLSRQSLYVKLRKYSLLNKDGE